MLNKTKFILGAIGIALAVLAAPLYAQMVASPSDGPSLAPVVVGESCPLTDEQKQKSVDTFKPIGQFMASEPRCVNCHGGVNPFASNTTHIGGRYELKFDQSGEVNEDKTFSDCQSCHSGLPGWRLAPIRVWFKGKDAPTLCEQMQSEFSASPGISPSGAESFIKHMSLDITDVKFIAEAFKGTRALDEVGKDEYEKDTQSTYKLEPPRGMTHERLVQLAQDWIKAMGGNIQQDPQCGCQPPKPKQITGTLAFDVSASYNFNTPLIPRGSATGTFNHHEQVSSRWESGPSTRQFDATIYIFTATNQIALDGSGNVSGDSGDSRTTGTGQISASGTSQNPARPGDDNFQVSFGQTRSGVQGVNGPSATQPGRLHLYKQNGKDLYQITLGISQLIAQYIYRVRTANKSCTRDETYDNLSATRTVVGCDQNSTGKSTGPLLFGTISPSHRKPNPDTGQFGGFIQGAYDPTKGVIEGNENFDSTDCGETVLVDPLYDMAATLFTAVGASVPRAGAGGSVVSPGTTCHVQYTLQWHIQLPPQ